MFTSCETNNSKLQQQNSHKLNPDSIADLEANEKNNPLTYLEVNSSYEKSIIGQWLIQGTITSNTKMCAYKDVVVIISYYNEAGLRLGAIQRTIEEDFGPGNTKMFRFVEEGLPSTDSIGVHIESVTNIN